MAAIYSGIHLKLKSPRTSWEDKLKLARFAWISSQCLLPNKEQVLLDWSTHALTGFYSKKVEFSQHVLEGLWHYLDDLLHSKKLHTFLCQGKTISIKLNMAQVLLDRLQESVCTGTGSSPSFSTLLSVCQAILSSPVLSSVFTTKFELMADLLAKHCSLACHRLQQRSFAGTLPASDKPEQSIESVSTEDEPQTESLQDHPKGLVITAQSAPLTQAIPDHPVTQPHQSQSQPPAIQPCPIFKVLRQVLSCYLAVQRQQTNSNRVFTTVTTHLLQPLILLRHLLISGEHLDQQLNRDMRLKIDSILQLSLFPSEHLSSYKEELLPPKEEHGKRSSGKGLLRPVSTIADKLSAQGYCESSLHYAVKSGALPMLFKFCLENYGKGGGGAEDNQRLLCFYFLTRLVRTLDIDLDASSPVPASSSTGLVNSAEDGSHALLALEALLNQTLSADVYNIAADRIRHGEAQFTYYRKLCQKLFNQAQPSIPAWYRCLKVLLGLNHLILEPDLDQLLTLAWVDSDCMESRVQRARQLLVCSLFQTYTKLHQLPRLFSELLSVICWPAIDDIRPPLLSEAVCSSLRACLFDTPPSQCLEICSVVLKSIKECILPDLQKMDVGREEMKMSGEGQREQIDGTDREREHASLKLLSHCQLLHAVLFSLKTVDNASPLPLVRQTHSLMEDMRQVVKVLLELVSSENMASNVGQQMDLNLNKNLKGKKKKRMDRTEANQSGQEPKSLVLWKQKTLEAALLLRYTWVEVDTLFDFHCSKYTSVEPAQAPSQNEDQASDRTLVPTNLLALLSGEILPGRLLTLTVQPSWSPVSCYLLKLLTLQQLKKALLNGLLLAQPGTTELLNKAAQFILAKDELSVGLDNEQAWDRHIGSVNCSSYHVAHWYLVTSNLPLLAPYLTAGDDGCVADVLLNSIVHRQSDKEGGLHDSLSGWLSVPLISSQLLQSSVLVELQSLYSATVRSLIRKVLGILIKSDAARVCPILVKFQEAFLPERARAVALTGNKANQASSTAEGTKALVKEILRSSETGESPQLLTDIQTQGLLNLLHIATNLNADGISSDDLPCLFILLFYILTSTCPDRPARDHPNPGDDARFLGKLLRLLVKLLEGSNFESVLKQIHGGSLLQAAVSSLIVQTNRGRFQSVCSSDWLELVKAFQGFISSLVELIIIRKSSVQLNLEQFTSYLTIYKTEAPESSILSLYLLLASLSSFSQTLTVNLGRSKALDETLTQMMVRTTAAMRLSIENVLKPQIVSKPVTQPAGVLGQAFLVQVVNVMLKCEIATLPAEADHKSCDISHMTLYGSFCQQILKEITSAPRPIDFLVSSIHFLSAYYCVVERKVGRGVKLVGEGNNEDELDELYSRILQNVHRLLTVEWLSMTELCELEPAVKELLRHLMERSTMKRFNLMMMMISEGLQNSGLSTRNYREALFAVTVTKLLSGCQIPEACSKALWLSVPQIISAMVFLVKSSSQDPSLTLALTVPTVTSMTALLRNGMGLISGPYHVTLVLGVLQLVPLEHLAPHVYQSAFTAVHEALYSIIQCHSQVMLEAAPSFLSVFYHLVASIMHEGRQKGDSHPGRGSDVYLQCSRLVERMYSFVAGTAENFTTLASFMVAQYVTELQKVTLRPEIKLHLREGIYQILDLCTESDIKFLTAGLQMGVREVFNELYNSYTHYHKGKKQGEEKYTV